MLYYNSVNRQLFQYEYDNVVDPEKGPGKCCRCKTIVIKVLVGRLVVKGFRALLFHSASRTWILSVTRDRSLFSI